MTKFADLYELKEDERIDVIGHQVMKHRKVVGFVVDDETGKAERYIRKLRERFPGIQVLHQGAWAGDTVLVKVGPPAESKEGKS